MSAHRPVTAEYLRAAGRHAGGAARWSSTVKTPLFHDAIQDLRGDTGGLW